MSDFVKQFYINGIDIPDEILTQYDVSDAELVGSF